MKPSEDLSLKADPSHQTMQENVPAKAFDGNITLERVNEVSKILANNVESAIDEIDRLNGQTHMIAINARIEASRAGLAGKAFSVVAEQMNDLSGKIALVSKKIKSENRDSLHELGSLVRTQAVNAGSARLEDLALSNLDIIGRNLHERTCDVRFWATDYSVVTACSSNDREDHEDLTTRFGILLDCYPGYFDLVLCDVSGKIIANGRPETYSSVGTNVKDSEWFTRALKTHTGKEFGFQTVNRCPLVNNKESIVISCTVRERGNPSGKITGVLGAVIRCKDLVQPILSGVSASLHGKEDVRVCIADDDGIILADSNDGQVGTRMEFLGRDELFRSKKGFMVTDYGNEKCGIAHASSICNEAYSSNWHSLIIQRIHE